MAKPPLVLLGSASGISAFGMAVLVPNLDLIGRVYGATPAITQFLVTAYTFGLALAQPVQGLLADRFGRRPVLLGGIAVFVGASLFCAYAQNLGSLIGGRFMQALGISVGTVVSRAVVRDLCDAEGTARALSVIAAALGIAPVVAPVIGGILGAELGWRWIFVATALIGAVVLAAVALRLPETLPKSARTNFGLGTSRQDFAALLHSRSFVGFTLIYGFVSSAFFVFLSVGATIFAGELGIGQRNFGLIWGAMALCYVIGAGVTNPLIGRFGFRALAKTSIGALVLATLLLPLSLVVGGVTLASLLAPLGLIMMLSGIVSPLAMAGAISNHPDRAGAASGLSSSLGIGMTIFFAVGSGIAYQGHALVTALLIAIAGVAAGVSLLLALAPDPRQTRSLL